MKTQNRKRRGNSRYFLFFVLILIALTGVGYGVYAILAHVPWFNLKTVKIEGNIAVSDSLIQSITDPYLGHNLFSIPKRDLRKQVLKFARIKEVKIKRRLFNTLSISILERKGFLYLNSLDGDLFPIDENGIVLEKYDKISSENLPMMNVLLESKRFIAGHRISNKPIKKVLELHKAIIREAPEFVQNISEYYTVNETVYIIDARNGIRMIPSAENIAKQLSRYEFVQDNGNVAKKSILDLRFNNQVVVKAGK